MPSTHKERQPRVGAAPKSDREPSPGGPKEASPTKAREPKEAASPTKAREPKKAASPTKAREPKKAANPTKAREPKKERRVSTTPRAKKEGREPRFQVGAKVLIGAAEYVRLPEWRIGRIRAKVDTGARTSALHVDNIVELPHDRVLFEVVLHRHNALRRVRVETPIVRRSSVRSSSGQAEHRIFVRTRMVLGAVEQEIEISLTSRGTMRYRMLLGRSALKGTFVVDAGRRYFETRMERHAVRRQRTSKRSPA